MSSPYRRFREADCLKPERGKPGTFSGQSRRDSASAVRFTETPLLFPAERLGNFLNLQRVPPLVSSERREPLIAVDPAQRRMIA